MEGRWNVHLDINGDLHENVPVVPCDDAAIKRAAYALCCDPIVELFDGPEQRRHRPRLPEDDRRGHPPRRW